MGVLLIYIDIELGPYKMLEHPWNVYISTLW